MTKEKVYDHLDISSLNVGVRASEWNNRESSWSKSLDVKSSEKKKKSKKEKDEEKEEVCKELYDIFKGDIDFEMWRERFFMAVDGTGKELPKITTLHSSSLLAFLFFSGVSENNPIIYNNIRYTQVFFEVKHKVFPSASSKDHPSNIDVLLVSENNEDLLFLESKLTEYLDHGKVPVAEKYLNFYKKFFEHNKKTGLQLKDDALQLEKGRNSKYIAGIKQMFSHIIGLATEPHSSTYKELKDIIKNAKHILIKEIIYKWEDKESASFAQLYEDVFKDFNSDLLEKCLSGEDCDKEKIRRITVDPDVLTYQELYNENRTHKFPEPIVKYYRLNEC